MTCGKLQSRVQTPGRQRFRQGLAPRYQEWCNRYFGVFGPGGCAVTPVTRTFRFHGAGQIIRERNMNHEVH